MKNYIKLFEEFSERPDDNELRDLGFNLNAWDDLPLQLDAHSDSLELKTREGSLSLRLDHELVGDLMAELNSVLGSLRELDPELRLRVLDADGGSDSGVGLEWTLPNGEQVFGPDLGVCNTVGEAVQELESALAKLGSALDSVDEEDFDTVVVSLD